MRAWVDVATPCKSLALIDTELHAGWMEDCGIELRLHLRDQVREFVGRHASKCVRSRAGPHVYVRRSKLMVDPPITPPRNVDRGVHLQERRIAKSTFDPLIARRRRRSRRQTRSR